ncbi:MAG: universal stress protein [Rhodothermales bacterium]
MYKKIFVPVDNSDHSMASIDVAVNLAKRLNASLVGSHAYAARMHDYRFKQMEFTLPEEYLVEEEMEKQRKVHDTLITMGLELISDSYLTVMQKRCAEENLPFKPKMYDGKNWKVIVQDVEESDYDLVVMGSLGLGAVRDSVLGSVVSRVVRRVHTDTLVVKNTDDFDVQMNGKEVGEPHGGHIVVGVDGSPESFAGLKTALELGRKLDKRVEAVSVYDPYLHYAMFNSIVNVLTEKASKVFRFKEQEQLHEEVIDTGLAKIYQSHLEVARRIAADEGVDLKITLLDGKAFDKILQYVRREKPWLLVVGRIGVHSDEDMDIGSNTENLLRMASCNVLLSSRRYTPPLDVQAEESMLWTDEATALVDTAPDFARNIARTTIHRWAMERGHSVITRKVVEQSMATILPESAMKSMGIIAETVARDKVESSDEVTYICSNCGYAARGFEPAVCAVCSAPPESFHKLDKEAIKELAPLEGALEEVETFDKKKLSWTRDARDLLRKVPDGYQMRRARAQIEKSARVKGLDTITHEMVAGVVADLLEDTSELSERGRLKPSSDAPERRDPSSVDLLEKGNYKWTPDAWARLERVPEGFMREKTRERMEEAADRRDTSIVTLEVAEEGIEAARKAMEEAIRAQNE